MTQELLAIPVESLLESVRRIHADGYRLVQICCTRLAHFELSYSFDKNHEFVSLRLAVPFEGASVPSISAVFGMLRFSPAAWSRKPCSTASRASSGEIASARTSSRERYSRLSLIR